MAIGSVFGVSYQGGYIKYAPDKGKQLSKSQDFKSVAVQGNIPAKADPAKLLSGDSLATLNKIKMSAGGNYETSAGIDKKKTIESVAVNYTSTKITGKSAALDAALSNYSGAQKEPEVKIKIYDKGVEKTLIIKANSFVAPNGQEIKYKGGDDLAKALKSAGLDIGGTITIDKTTVQDHSYTDENGNTQVQKGFTLVNFKIKTATDEKSVSLSVDDDFTENDITLQNSGEAIVEEKYAMSSNVETITESPFQFILYSAYNTGVDMAKIMEEQRRNEEYLRAISSVTGNTNQVV
jgi:hypothetical protein